MPPKPKFSREEMIAAALELVSERGVEALTTRGLGERLGCSARPIFTLFRNMEELFLEVRKAAMRRFESYAERVTGYAPAFKRTGVQMVLFGAREPKLYQLLFMQENRQASDFEDVLGTLGATAEKCIANLCSEYGLSREQAHAVFEPVWIYTFGIGTLHATRVCQFSEAQVERMLSTEFSAMLHLVKASDTMSKHAEKGAD